MKEFNSVLVEYNCHECNKYDDFTDGLDMNGMRSHKCKDFESKFIKNIEDREIRYNINFRCNKCKGEGKLQFIFKKSNMNDMDNNNYKTYTCQCGAKVTVGTILLLDQKEGKSNNVYDIQKKRDINDINSNNYNQNINFNNNFNYNNNNKFMMNNMNAMNNIYMNNMNNINIMNSMNNMNYMMNLNNIYRMNNMNNHNNINSMNNINIKNISNQFNNMNLNDNLNNIPSIRLTFVFSADKIEKNVPFNKKLKDVLEEIKIEKPELVKFINNIRNDILLCEGEFIDIKQTPEQINKESKVLHDGSELVYQFIKTLFNDGNMNNRFINLTFVFNNDKIKKSVPFNKKIKDVLEEIKIEKPELAKFINNIRNDILLCEGEFVDIKQTPEEINKENKVLNDGSELVYQFIKTLLKDQ